MSTIFDPGLQPERTQLAWRRACLSFGLAGAVGLRFAIEDLGAVAILPGLAVVGLSAAAYAASAHRYRRGYRSLMESGVLTTDAAPLFLIWLAGLAAGIGCVAFIVAAAAP